VLAPILTVTESAFRRKAGRYVRVAVPLRVVPREAKLNCADFPFCGREHHAGYRVHQPSTAREPNPQTRRGATPPRRGPTDRRYDVEQTHRITCWCVWCGGADMLSWSSPLSPILLNRPAANRRTKVAAHRRRLLSPGRLTVGSITPSEWKASI